MLSLFFISISITQCGVAFRVKHIEWFYRAEDHKQIIRGQISHRRLPFLRLYGVHALVGIWQKWRPNRPGIRSRIHNPVRFPAPVGDLSLSHKPNYLRLPRLGACSPSTWDSRPLLTTWIPSTTDGIGRTWNSSCQRWATSSQWLIKITKIITPHLEHNLTTQIVRLLVI